MKKGERRGARTQDNELSVSASSEIAKKACQRYEVLPRVPS